MSFRSRLAWSVTLLALGSLVVSIAGASLLRNSSLQAGSQEERTEKTENVTLDVRRGSERRNLTCGGRITIDAGNRSLVRSGQFSRTPSRPADGHRLPNGLLAPLTC